MRSSFEKHYKDINEMEEAYAKLDIGSLRKVEVNPFSNRVSNIALIRDDPNFHIAKATAFLYRYESTYWLITNHHNFSGVNMVTRRRIDDWKGSPLKYILPIPMDGKIPRRESAIFDLYTDETPNWFIHPEFGYEVDVVAMPLGFKDDQRPVAINDPGMLTATQRLRVSDDVFVIGYPGVHKDSRLESSFPIWKRASIAFEPDLDSGGLPRMYVDTASRPGMSGSPVLLKCQETINNAGLYDYSLAGVYSGRLGSGTGLDTQLGIVWKTSVIEEIIRGNKKDELFYPSESFPDEE